MLWSVSPSTQTLPPGFTCLNNKSAQHTECVQFLHSFPPAQTQRCWSGLTLTSPCSAQEQKGCCHPFCSADPHLVLCFHLFCLFDHISYLQTPFLLVPFGILFIWVWTHTPVHTSVLFPCIFFLHVTVCLYFPFHCFLPAAFKSCKHSNFFWHTEAATITPVQVWG